MKLAHTFLLPLLYFLSACSSHSSLFDSASLSGWMPVGDAQWEVRGGTIQAAGKGDGFLLSNEEYANFDLYLEFWIDATTNSGVFIRCTDAQDIRPGTCYEMNIWDQHPQQQARTGAIVAEVMPPLVQAHTVGQWNTYRIRAEGPILTVRVNDQITALMTDARSQAGFIALQHAQKGTVRFRNIRLQQL